MGLLAVIAEFECVVEVEVNKVGTVLNDRADVLIGKLVATGEVEDGQVFAPLFDRVDGLIVKL